MDIFSECMVKRKKKPSDYGFIALCIVGILLVLLLSLFFAGAHKYIGLIALFVTAALIYVLYNMIISTNLEYEYAFTNGSFDVDKIIAKKRRKHIVTLNARNIELMAPISHNDFSRYYENKEIKKIAACSSKTDDGVYFILFDDNGKRTILLFNPNEEMLDGFKRLNPQKVFLS